MSLPNIKKNEENIDSGKVLYIYIYIYSKNPTRPDTQQIYRARIISTGFKAA
jgi:hypothetical protein